eukprot:scaffold92676_cov30-Tisochrysis_lutea.AAC.4
MQHAPPESGNTAAWKTKHEQLDAINSGAKKKVAGMQSVASVWPLSSQNIFFVEGHLASWVELSRWSPQQLSREALHSEEFFDKLKPNRWKASVTELYRTKNWEAPIHTASMQVAMDATQTRGISHSRDRGSQLPHCPLCSSLA